MRWMPPAKFWVVLFLGLLMPWAGLASAAERLVLQLPWHHQFQFAGYYLAKAKGYYQEAGFDVEIRDVTRGEDPVDEVISGRADFGISGSGLLVERSQGKPVVAVAPIFQKSPAIFLALATSGIREPADFSGKKVMLSPGFLSLPLLALLQQEGLLDKIKRIETSFDVNSLLNGQTDVFNAYSSNEPYLLKSQGYPPSIINPEDYGIYFYGDTLFTVESLLQTRPDTVEKFRTASIKGWNYALSHPDEAIALIRAQYQPQKTVAQLQFEADQIRKVIQPEQVAIGAMDLARWAQMTHHLIALGAVPANFQLSSDFLYTPPSAIDWKHFGPWIVGILAAFSLLFAFLGTLFRTNVQLKSTRKELQEEILERKQALQTILRQKETAQQYLDIAGVMFGALNSQGEIILMNRKGSQILGYAEGELLGRNWFELCLPATAQTEIKEVFRQQMSGKFEPLEFYENEILTRTGETRILAFHNSLLRDERGICGVLFSGEDVTERKRAEEGLIQAKAAAESANRTKSAFLANMSHELRTPMASILGMLEIVLTGELAEEQRKHLEVVEKSAETLMRILNDILDFSKIEAGMLILVEAPFDLHECIREAVELFALQAQQKGLKLVVEIAAGTPQGVSADEGRIRQLLVNLVGNAMKFTARGEVALRVSAGDRSADGRQITRFAVSDTGIGIPEDKQKDLFAPFIQGDASHTRRFGGTGLGLSISQSVAERMGGTLTCTSELGRGSTFTLTLPLRETAIATPALGTGKGVESEGMTTEMHEVPYLLVAEDDEALRTLMGLQLEQKGIRFDFACDGEEVVAMWSQGHYDLVLMDIQMPLQNGYEATHAIREQEKTRGGHVPIVALTAHAYQADRQQSLSTGMDAYLSKPIKAQKLFTLIGELLSKKGELS